MRGGNLLCLLVGAAIGYWVVPAVIKKRKG